MDGTPSGDELAEDLVTHGICTSCIDNLEFQLGVSIKRFLNSFAVPVIVVDSERRAVSANRNALDMLEKELNAVTQLPLGNVFECAYSRLPGGCGKTYHCSGCTIRTAVNDTYETGRPNLAIPATVETARDGGGTLSFMISTEKVLNFILLRIDRGGDGELSSPA
jgi:hypothetical protein